MYRLDRTAFKAQRFSEADNHFAYWRDKTPAERLRAATYLIRSAWNIGSDEDFRMRRVLTSIRYYTLSHTIFNQDFQDFIRALNEQEVAYMLVGGYAVILHGYPRTTGDMDIWVEPTVDNYSRLTRAFQAFGMLTFDMTEAKFLQPDRYDVFTFGVPPVAIDLMTKVKGLDFSAAQKNATWHEFADFRVQVIGFQALLTAKAAAGRPRDLNDLEQLRAKE
jgi:hypothetical protein